jgi:hypothetical protein
VRVQTALAVPSVPGVVPLGVLGQAALAEEIRRADVVVSHAGSGTSFRALAAGHRPILVPRRRGHGEGVDDHQVDLARELERRGKAVVAPDPLARTLSELVRDAPSRGRATDTSDLGPHLRREADRARRPRGSGGAWTRRVGPEAYARFYERCPERNPLQSSAWGVARGEDGWRAEWWLAGPAGREATAGLQCLRRATPGPGYVPYGPTCAPGREGRRAGSLLLRRLADRSVAGLLWTPGAPVEAMGAALARRAVPLEPPSTTGLLDLSAGEEALLRTMHREWRRLLARAVEDPRVQVDWPTPEELLPSVLAASRTLAGERGYKPPVPLAVASRFAALAERAGVRLVACTVRVDGDDCASYLATVAGDTAAALWIANWKSDPGAGRRVLWEVCRRARSMGATTYDLGGIDDLGNPGVALFKRKLRPRIVPVPGLHWLPPRWLPAPLVEKATREVARRVVPGTPARLAAPPPDA